MAKSFGWAGALLNVDLSDRGIQSEELSPSFARKYLGASGFNAAKLFDLVGAETDALSPENVLMIGIGPLAGTLAPGSARLTVTAKSPLTDIYGDSNMGGHFAAELKFAGFDQIVLRGMADRPVYLWLDGGKAELREAAHLWGKTTWDTARLIQEELHDPGIQVACIGPAGENLVRFANIMCPTKRAAGRTGMGAVMGSKNLKAIAVRGSKPVNIFDSEGFLAAVKEMRDVVVETYPHYQLLHTYGTPGLLEVAGPKGQLIVKHYDRTMFADWDAISGRTLKRDHYKSMRGCSACEIACGPFSNVQAGEFAGVYGEGPEFALIGRSLLMDIDNPGSLQKMNELSNQLGIDYLSACGVIAWAMDCCEKGLLTSADFDGRPLRFGDYRAVIEMLPKIAMRQGFGAVLAEGEKRVAGLVGRGSEKLMWHVKGMLPVAEDPRAHKGFGLGYLTGTRGADHLKGCILHMRYLLRDSDIGRELGRDRGWNVTDPHGVGKTLKWCEDMTQVVDSLGMCTRTGGSLQLLTRALSCATGVNFTEDELLAVGERVFNLERAFSARLGLDRRDDDFSVPGKFMNEPVKDGPCEGALFERDVMLDEYYQSRGWDVTSGLQTRGKLSSLGLDHVAAALERVGALR